jgi:pimeloyl-ACP methyl ester carboxylesterase
MTLTDEPFRFLERGQGKAVVLLHGLFGRPENWVPIIEDLSDEFHLLAPQFPIDHQPHRRSQDFRSIHQLTDYVRAFLDHAGIERASIGGNSLGGQVAIDFCLRYPKRAQQLIITGSAGLFERSLSGGRIPQVTREFIREKACEIFYDPKHVTEELVDEVQQMLRDRTYVRFLIKVAKATRNYNVKDELAKLKLPTLIVWGRDDQITPPSVAKEFKENLENAWLVFLDRCGHSPPIEQPRAFSQVLREFLKDPVTSPSRSPI